MAATAFVRTRINPELRDDATAVLNELGLTVSEVMRMTLTRIAKEKGLPFELSVPNAETRAALEEAQAMREARRHRFKDGTELLNALEEEAGE